MLITISINGYKFATEQEAIDARALCDVHYGYPKSPDDITQHHVSIYEAKLDSPVFWFISGDDSLFPVLGVADSFDVTYDNPFAT